MDPQGLTDYLLPWNEDDAKREKERVEPPAVIYTAVTGSEPAELCSAPEENNDDVQVGAASKELKAQFLGEAVKPSSLLLGLLVGCFIQLSSLGASYFFSVYFGATLQKNPKRLIDLSFGWSVFTSVMAVVVLLLVRFIVLAVWKDRSSKTRTTHKNVHADVASSLFLDLECFFSVGTLVGVCASWTAADYFLGYREHILHSLATFLVALVWCKVLVYCLASDPAAEPEPTVDVETRELSKKLIDSEEAPTPHGVEHSTSFQVCCALLGLIIGFFVQFSSMGANFVSVRFLNANASMSHIFFGTNAKVFFFSLTWSIVTSVMGILILTFCRGLVVSVFEYFMECDFETRRQGIEQNVRDKFELSLLCLDGLFVGGALVGVSSAWVIVDALLGIKVPLVHYVMPEALGLAAIGACVYCRSRQLQAGQEFVKSLEGDYSIAEP